MHYLRHHSRLVYHTPACNPVTDAGRYRIPECDLYRCGYHRMRAAVWLAVKTGSRLVAELKDKSGEERIAALNEIGILYAEAKQTDEAITYLEMSLSEKKDLGKGYRALLNLYNTKRREAAKAKDDEQIQYYLRKIDEMMAISKEVTRASF